MESGENGRGADTRLGIWQEIPCPSITRYLAAMGWDFVVLDMQHGPMSVETAYECTHILRAAEVQPWVRVSVGASSEIQRVLDIGAQAVVVPMVNTAEEALLAAQAAKYPPLGGRSVGGDFAIQQGSDYPERANRETKLLVQVEHFTSVQNIDDILAVPGIDGVFLGPTDLALSMGLSRNDFVEERSHKEAMSLVLEATHSSKKLACCNSYCTDDASRRVAEHWQYVTFRSDVDLIMDAGRSCYKQLQKTVSSTKLPASDGAASGAESDRELGASVAEAGRPVSFSHEQDRPDLDSPCLGDIRLKKVPMSLESYRMYIDGAWCETDESTPVFDPSTGAPFATTPIATANNVARAVDAATRAQKEWGRRPATERGALLRAWADAVDREADDLARTITREEGKPLSESRGEVDFGNSWFRYYAEFDRRIEGDILSADRPNEQLWIVRQPLGVVSAIIPWNYPMAVAVRKIAPALIAGNAIVLKPHEETPLSSLELARLAEEVGIPRGVFNVVTGPGETVGEMLVRNPLPRLITFTGSVATGKRIARLAAENVAVVSLEMGGKAPFIVMDDCDLDAAVETAVFSRFFNCGQVCICNERTYVHQSVIDAFLDKFLAKVHRIQVGHPLHEGTTVGPKVSQGELEKVERYVNDAKQQGARVLAGGKRLSDGEYAQGYWFQPTVLTDVRQEMDVMQKEIFGPVIPVMPFADFDEGLRLGNDSRYGLAAYLFTDDLHRVMRAVRDLECGEIYVNRGPGESIHGYHTGWKESGIGGDDGKYGLEHYLHKKTVYLKFNG